MHYPLGILSQPRDGVRPLLASTLHPLVFTLFDPRDLSQILFETEGPAPNSSSAPSPVCGDFDGDGSGDVALLISTEGEQLLVLDEQTLETQTMREFTSEDFRPVVAAIDVDGDGVDELVTAAEDGGDRTVRAWALMNGSLREVGSAVLALERSPTIARGDFDGDSTPDLAFVLSSESESLWVLRGASLEGTTLPLEQMPQPTPARRSVAADADGDGDDELIVLHTLKSLTIMDWSGGGLQESGVITVDIDAEERSTPSVYVGEDEGRPDWLILGKFERPDEVFHVAVFPGREETSPVVLGHTVGFGRGLVADYNDDGLSDFMVTGDNGQLLYLSGE